MKIKLLIAAILMTLASPVMADFVTRSLAYEVEITDLTVPISVNSRILFTECDECDHMAIRLTPDTRFVVNGRGVQFDKFRHAVKQAASADIASVTVLHHLESDTVVSISVTFK